MIASEARHIFKTRPEALWIVAAALVAAILVPRSWPSLTVTYFWGALATMLLAVAGRRQVWAARSAAIAAGVVGLFVIARYGLRAVGGTPAENHADWAYAAGGLVVAAISAARLVRRPSRIAGADPVVILAAQLFIALAGRWLYYALIWASIDPSHYSADTLEGALAIELPNLGLGLAAVGLGVSRDLRGASERLGLRWPSFISVGFGVTVGWIFLSTSYWVNWAMYLLTPRDYFRIAAILQNSETGVSTPTFVLIAILAGVSEEILFRGALQPKFGIILAATAFALIHVQYGPSLILAVIFIHGLGYGLLRRYLDTTAAISAHLMYDLAAFVPISHRLIGLIGLSLLAVGFIRNRLAPGVPDDSEGEAV